MRFLRRSSPIKALFDLTPLIDCVFLLLIFFMVSTSFATLRQGIKVNLPPTRTPQEKLEEKIVISLTRDGHIFLGKKPVKKKELFQALKKKLKGREGTVLINADREVLHGKVVEVMDISKRAGAKVLGILTRREEKIEGEF